MCPNINKQDYLVSVTMLKTKCRQPVKRKGNSKETTAMSHTVVSPRSCHPNEIMTPKIT